MEKENTPPRWFWFLAGLALVWMLFGLLSLIMDPLTSEAALEEMTETERALFEERPFWLFVMYAISVLSGLAGAIALLMRKAWAVPAFAVSLVFLVVQFLYVLFIMDAMGRLGAREALPFPLLIFSIGVLLLYFALQARRKDWLDR